jgi:serine protease Do
VGTGVAVEVLRAGKPVALKVRIEALPEEAEESGMGEPENPADGNIEITRLKLKVRNLKAEEKKRSGLRTGGVLVEGVGPGAARDAGVRPGDVVVQIAFKDTPDINTLKGVVAALAPGDKVPMLVNREGSPLFMALQVPPAP